MFDAPTHLEWIASRDRLRTKDMVRELYGMISLIMVHIGEDDPV